MGSELPVWESAFAAVEMKNDLVMSLRRSAVTVWQGRIEDFLESADRLLGHTPDAYRSLLVDLALDIGRLTAMSPATTATDTVSGTWSAEQVDEVRTWLLTRVQESLTGDRTPPSFSPLGESRAGARPVSSTGVATPPAVRPSRPTKGSWVTGLSGTPTGRRVNRIRARRAAALLSAGASVETAAALVGYDNATAFYPVFHGVFGCSPADYRQRNTPRRPTSLWESRPGA